MNAFGQVDKLPLQLVDIVDFKWLMAGDGVHVHVERLQSDRVYALEVLAAAARSTQQAVRQAAARLRTQLGLDDSAGPAAG